MHPASVWMEDWAAVCAASEGSCVHGRRKRVDCNMRLHRASSVTQRHKNRYVLQLSTELPTLQAFIMWPRRSHCRTGVQLHCRRNQIRSLNIWQFIKSFQQFKRFLFLIEVILPRHWKVEHLQWIHFKLCVLRADLGLFSHQMTVKTNNCAQMSLIPKPLHPKKLFLKIEMVVIG